MPAERLALDRRGDAVGARAGARGEEAREAVRADPAVGGGRLDHPVGEQDERVAGVQHERLLADLRVLEDPQQRAGTPGRLDPAVGAQHEWQRVAAGRHRRRDVALARRERDVEDGAEAVVEALAQQGFVELGEHGARAPRVEHGGAQRVPGEGGHRRRLGALAADVADHQRPVATAGGEAVVEVAADLVALPGGDVASGELHAGDLRQPGGQQRALQGAGDVVALGVQARAVQRQRGPPAELLEQRQQIALVRRGELLEARDQRAVDTAAGASTAC